MVPGSPDPLLKGKCVDVNTVETLVRMMALIGALIVFFFSFLMVPFVFKRPEIAQAFGSAYSWIYWFVFSGLVFVLALASYFLSPMIIERQFRLKPLNTEYPEVCDVVHELSRTLGISRLGRQYLLDSPEANSFVFGRFASDARLVLTRGLLKLLEKDELNAVILHELSHIRNRDMAFMTWGTTFVKALKYWFVAFIGTTLTFEAFLDALGYEELLSNLVSRGLLAFSVFIAVPTLTVHSVSRVREFLADARAAFSTDSVSSLISALLKVSRSLVLSSIVKKRYAGSACLMFVNVIPSKRLSHLISRYTVATHPSLGERLDALKSRKYEVSGSRLYLPTVEASAYAGLIAFYFFVSLTFSYASALELAGVKFKDNPLLAAPLIFVPLSVIVYLNNYTTRYSDLKILDGLNARSQLSFFSGIIGRNLISCLALLGLALLIGINLESVMYVIIPYFLLSILCSMSYLLFRSFRQKIRTTRKVRVGS